MRYINNGLLMGKLNARLKGKKCHLCSTFYFGMKQIRNETKTK